MNIGLISDTHGRLPSEVFDVFDGVEHILHAGDIGSPDLLAELEAIAPVTAVWGNTDGFGIRDRVPERAAVELAGRHIVVVHGHQLGSPKPPGLIALAPAADIILYGHTHRPLIQQESGCLVVNPGSAGAPRFGLPASVAVMTAADEVSVELIDLT